MTLTDIAHLCATVSRLQHKQNWTLQATPVICFQFSTMNDFFQAKSDLERMISSEPFYATDPKRLAQITRVSGPDTVELDCYGVTFRLICLQRMDTAAGPKGVGQVDPPTFDWEALKDLRAKGWSF